MKIKGQQGRYVQIVEKKCFIDYEGKKCTRLSENTRRTSN